MNKREHIAKELRATVVQAEADLENDHPQAVLERVLREVSAAATELEADA
jgi:hypothetical protein